jgi:putative Mg2+ transporter-C (MgtC) family protein
MELGETLIRLALALLLAFPIGWQREAEQKPAGLRTHLLVSLGCCLFVLINLAMAAGDPRVDPTRIAAQVVTGIGFLGGGVIFRASGSVRGLTTAASVWVAAAIGMACGAAYYRGALATSVGAFFVLTVVERWERRVLGRKIPIAFQARYRDFASAHRVREELQTYGFRAEEVTLEMEGQEVRVRFSGHAPSPTIAKALASLADDAGYLGMEKTKP